MPRTWSKADTGGAPANALEGCTSTDKGTIVCGLAGASNVYVSRDGGNTFALQALGVAFNYPQRPQYGNGVILLGGLSDNIVYGSTDDAQTWKQISTTLTSQNGTHSFVYGGGVWVAAAGGNYGDTQTLQYSTDNGATWSAALTTGTAASFTDTSLCYDGSQFLICGSNATPTGYIATSPDGKTWTAHEVTSGLSSINALAAVPGLYFLGNTSNGYAIATSVAALTAAAPQVLPNVGGFAMDIIKPVILSDGTVIVMTNQGNAMISLDRGATWQQDTPPWTFEPNGSANLQAYPVALVNGRNLICALENAQRYIGLRGVNC